MRCGRDAAERVIKDFFLFLFFSQDEFLVSYGRVAVAQPMISLLLASVCSVEVVDGKGKLREITE